MKKNSTHFTFRLHTNIQVKQCLPVGDTCNTQQIGIVGDDSAFQVGYHPEHLEQWMHKLCWFQFEDEAIQSTACKAHRGNKTTKRIDNVLQVLRDLF